MSKAISTSFLVLPTSSLPSPSLPSPPPPLSQEVISKFEKRTRIPEQNCLHLLEEEEEEDRVQLRTLMGPIRFLIHLLLLPSFPSTLPFSFFFALLFFPSSSSSFPPPISFLLILAINLFPFQFPFPSKFHFQAYNGSETFRTLGNYDWPTDWLTDRLTEGPTNQPTDRQKGSLRS